MKITVIGAGSWGTALALHFASHGNEVALWTRNPEQVRTLQAERENKHGLPGFPFPESLTVYAEINPLPGHRYRLRQRLRVHQPCPHRLGRHSCGSDGARCCNGSAI